MRFDALWPSLILTIGPLGTTDCGSTSARDGDGSIRTSKNLDDPAGGFSITFADIVEQQLADSVAYEVEPQDMVEIRAARWPHLYGGQLPLVMRGFISQVMREAKEIGTRIGIPIDQQPEDRHAVTRKLGAFKTSMLQDVEAGKPVELDALVTVVQELGVLTAVPTPFTDALLGLSRLQARGLY